MTPGRAVAGASGRATRVATDVTSIAPATILTERNMDLIPDSLRQSLVELHPVRRLGTPEDVAGRAQ
jgi:NAD(P)-dependent dehydrogenase (short-subunit alcohol dehydrogenase family)